MMVPMPPLVVVGYVPAITSDFDGGCYVRAVVVTVV